MDLLRCIATETMFYFSKQNHSRALFIIIIMKIQMTMMMLQSHLFEQCTMSKQCFAQIHTWWKMPRSIVM